MDIVIGIVIFIVAIFIGIKAKDERKYFYHNRSFKPKKKKSDKH
ncbi:hypothetical protein [Flavobacterium capsici]|uniref:Uncharacterized protein n=1 Tax=Flavobacterium capsici TaxID=3075618 RepID=A0AA96JBI7_9FLAO|nr:MULTISPECIES: hypothetical protein [unclassified Flavobacterium]WNM18628.1 hypothetical protein RN608_11480 [Flavobacterium sp. PMR2A8]WNM22679.1 hypothetical protein RN605_04780 [Flavobacterium sp. PMTSA4]